MHTIKSPSEKSQLCLHAERMWTCGKRLWGETLSKIKKKQERASSTPTPDLLSLEHIRQRGLKMNRLDVVTATSRTFTPTGCKATSKKRKEKTKKKPNKDTKRGTNPCWVNYHRSIVLVLCPLGSRPPHPQPLLISSPVLLRVPHCSALFFCFRTISV